jgi:hypothetical protein
VFPFLSSCCWQCVRIVDGGIVEQIIDPRPDSATIGLGPLPSKSAASWPAIFAGAFVAAAASLLLISLGSGIGFASVSPWPNRGISVTTFAMTTAIWLIVTQWISSGLGGYIAGRLRTRWIGTHAHEVFFRDTAHGLVTWAVATVLIAAVAAASVVSGVGAGARAASEGVSTMAQGLASSAQGAASSVSHAFAYDIDKLFRPAGTAAVALSADQRTEAAQIIGNALTVGKMPDADRSYLADQIAARTGISQADAQSRVDNAVAAATDAQTKLKADADSARKAASEASIYLALSMLIGAFIASVSAALGGRLRDEHI